MASTIATAPTTAAAGAAPAGAAQSAASAAASTTTGLGGDFQTFLKLLTTQLRNQDPTNAMTPEQMTQQLVQFAGVEQQMRMNTSLDSLIGLQQAAQLTASAPLLGRRVEFGGSQLSLQNGSATLRLPAAGAATTAQVQVLDSGGRPLREARVTLGTGVTEWTWDGRTASGAQLPDGAYRIAVSGMASDGTTRALSATAIGQVTGTQRVNGSLQLVLGKLGIGYDQVQSLLQN